jgi:hypothetical protein
MQICMFMTHCRLLRLGRNTRPVASLSRAISISRASKQGSSVSKKSISHQEEYRSTRLETIGYPHRTFRRMESYRKAAYRLFRSPFPPLFFYELSSLIDIIKGVADIEHNTAKEMTRLGAVIQVPFRSGNQFLGGGGLQVTFSPLSIVFFHTDDFGIGRVL